MEQKEQHQVFMEAKSNLQVRNKIVENNLGLIPLIAKQYVFTGVEYQDLYSVASIGLIKAVNTFDPLKEIKFSTYSTTVMRNEILMFLKRHRKTRLDVSMNTVIAYNDGDELTIEETICDENDRLEEVIQRMMNESVMNSINTLSKQQILLLKLLMLEYSQMEIAKELGISQPQVSRVYRKTIKQLQKIYYID